MTELTQMVRSLRLSTFLLVEADSSTLATVASELSESGYVVRRVRGNKMPTIARLFDEFAAAMQFPWYFGENGSAFSECLSDLSWIPSAVGYALIISNPCDLLAEEAGDSLSWLVTSLRRIQDEWATTVADGEDWDHPAVPFSVILQSPKGEAGNVEAAWTQAGAQIYRPW